MSLRRPLRSRVKVWLVITAVLFIGAWFLPGGKGGGYMPVGVVWWVFITGDYICSVGDMITGVSIITLSIAVSVAVIGAILQFPVCLMLDYFHRGKTRDETHVA